MKVIPFFKLFFAAALFAVLAACDSGGSNNNSTDDDTDTDTDTVFVAEPSITSRVSGDSDFTVEWSHELDDGGDDDQDVTYTLYYAEVEIEIDEDEDGNVSEEDLSLEDLLSRFDSLMGNVTVEGVESPLTVDGLQNDTTYYFVITATTDVELEDETVVSGTSDPTNEVSAIPRATPALVTYQVNDSGYSECGDYSFFIDVDRDGVVDSSIDITTNSGNHNNHIDCIAGGTDPDGDTTPETSYQDAFSGRDYLAATSSLAKVGAGQAGFDFTKLNANGDALAEDASEWACVQDNYTGLVWESKTVAAGLHSKDDRYTWYSSNEITNGGFEGYQQVTDFDVTEENNSCSGYTEGDESSYCNTEAFVARVNAANLCGFSDWRMPTRQEALGLVYFQLENIDGLRPEFVPSIDTDYFPNTEVSEVTDSFENARYMTASPYAQSSSGIWGVSFGTGVSPALSKGELNPVRLVRTTP